MLATIRSLGVKGIGGYGVSVEVFVSNGLVNFDIVGLPDAAVKEARERVRAAIKSNGFKFPVSRVTVNLAPADTKKAGTVYDLPIMLGILAATGIIRQPKPDCAFFGELSLNGTLRHVNGALPMAARAYASCSFRPIMRRRRPMPRALRCIRSRMCPSSLRICAASFA